MSSSMGVCSLSSLGQLGKMVVVVGGLTCILFVVDRCRYFKRNVKKDVPLALVAPRLLVVVSDLAMDVSRLS